MIVIDASALIEVLLGTTHAAAIRTRVFAVGETLHGPHLLDIEVAQVLRRYVARRDLDVARAALALEHLAAFPIRRYAHTVLLPRRVMRHRSHSSDAPVPVGRYSKAFADAINA